MPSTLYWNLASNVFLGIYVRVQNELVHVLNKLDVINVDVSNLE